MALKGVLAFILRHFAESGSFWANYIKLTETVPMVSATAMQLKDSSFWQYIHSWLCTHAFSFFPENWSTAVFSLFNSCNIARPS